MFQAALFDMDGVLIDSERIWVDALLVSLRRHGENPPWEEVARLEIGRPWNVSYLDFKKRWPNAIESQAQISAETEAYYNDFISHNDASIPGSIALLKRLSQTIPTALVSGSSKRRVLETVNMLNIAPFLSLLLTEEECPQGKPSPAPYLMAAEKLGIMPQKCIVFEDSEAGILSAKNAGMYCVALRQQLPVQPDQSKADLILDNLNDFQL